jgi:hypothetical protein
MKSKIHEIQLKKIKNMSKVIAILMTVLITITSCNSQKKVAESTASNDKQATDVQFVYEATTRGFHQKITVKDKEVFVTKDRDSKELGVGQKISDSDWKELTGYLNTFKLENLETFKDPTQKRFYDGAAIGSLMIIQKGKEYKSNSFDHGTPPVEIEKLVNKINSFVPKQ